MYLSDNELFMNELMNNQLNNETCLDFLSDVIIKEYKIIHDDDLVCHDEECS